MSSPTGGARFKGTQFCFEIRGNIPLLQTLKWCVYGLWMSAAEISNWMQENTPGITRTLKPWRYSQTSILSLKREGFIEFFSLTFPPLTLIHIFKEKHQHCNGFCVMGSTGKQQQRSWNRKHLLHLKGENARTHSAVANYQHPHILIKRKKRYEWPHMAAWSPTAKWDVLLSTYEQMNI